MVRVDDSWVIIRCLIGEVGAEVEVVEISANSCAVRELERERLALLRDLLMMLESDSVRLRAAAVKGDGMLSRECWRVASSSSESVMRSGLRGFPFHFTKLISLINLLFGESVDLKDDAMVARDA